MRYERKKINFIHFYCLIVMCLLCSCQSTRIHNYGEPATDARTNLDELRIEQTEGLRTGDQISRESTELRETSDRLSQEIGSTDEYYNRIREILKQVRETERPNHGGQ